MKEKIQSYIKTWENRCYKEGIPDQAPKRLEQLNKVPSYRKICIAILKNDNSLESLGFNKVKSKVYHDLKKIELQQRNKIQKQLKLEI